MKLLKSKQFIEVDGIRFYKDKHGYWFGGNGKKCMRLHVYVWEKQNGKVPKGYHVHHIDQNKDNNHISNLKIMPFHDHISYHSRQEQNSSRSRYIMNTFARPMAIEYHKSERSTPFHKQHYQAFLAKLHEQKITKTCQYCGNEYQVDACIHFSKFCSNACKSNARRTSGVDNEERTCVICGSLFHTNKYSKAKTCSGTCSIALRKENAKSKNEKICWI